MSDIPEDLKFTSQHEWVRENDDGTVDVGITDHAQTALGDLVFVELPESDADFVQGDACAVVESVKAASDVYAPLTGTVVAANEALGDAPEQINEDPYGDGWIYKLRPGSPIEMEELLSPEAYQALLAEADD
jgi:glycine cleavage system H protein